MPSVQSQRWMLMDRQNHNCAEAKTLENSSAVGSGISLFCLDQHSVHVELNIKREFRVLWNPVFTSNVPERNSWIWKRKQVRQIVWARTPVMVRSQDSSLSTTGSSFFSVRVYCCEWVHFNPKHDLFLTVTKQLLMPKPTQIQQSTVKCDCKWNRSAKIQNKKVKPSAQRSKSAGFALRHQKSIWVVNLTRYPPLGGSPPSSCTMVWPQIRRFLMHNSFLFTLSEFISFTKKTDFCHSPCFMFMLIFFLGTFLKFACKRKAHRITWPLSQIRIQPEISQ